MKDDLLKNNRKALFALLLCSGFIAAHPLVVMAENKSYSVQNVQQKQVVSGIVRDSSGEPVIGASVLEKGTTNGTITDLDGKFTLSVSSNTVLQISYIGYKTLELKATSNMKITLQEDSETLDEVVVVGYGVQKKSDVTGSVTSVSKDRLSKLPVTNVLQAIQGATAGVTITQESSVPGDEPSVLVRGQNSISANTGPYVVVDGIPISKSGGSLNDINPNDIESMEILKDASATAIYGTNGANGVILITTKKGKSGKPVVRYSGYVGIDKIAHMLEPMGPEQYLQKYQDWLSQNGYTDRVGKDEYAVPNAAERDNYELWKNGQGGVTDWTDFATQTGIIQDHNISVNGGGEKVRYYLSGDYMNQEGVLKGYQYKRYSFRANIDATITDYLKIGTTSYITAHNTDGGRSNLMNAVAQSPFGEPYDEDGNLSIYPMSPETLWSNPLLDTTKDIERRKFNVNINGYAEVDFGHLWKPLQGLTYKLNAGYSYMPERYGYYAGRAANDNNGTAETWNKETASYTIENIVTYARDFGKHHLDLTGLYSAQRKKYNYNYAKGVGFINDVLTFHDLSTASTQSSDSETTKYTALSQMGRVNYSYDSRYLFTFTVRRDGSSVFGKNTSKYGVFPSVALGWNISREAFMERTSNWLSNLKLRLSYGKSGNEAIDSYQTVSTMESLSMVFGGLTNTALRNSVMGNGDLEWETTKTFNFGLDFGFLNQRISGNLDVYRSNSDGLLLERSIPTITGYSSVWQNIGKTANTGVELTINTHNIQTRDFNWNTSLVFSWNKNEIKDLYGDGQDDIANKWFIGQPIGVIYDYTQVGIWQEDEIEAGEHLNWDPVAKAGDYKLADLNGDGQITEADKSVLGQTSPKWIGGMTNTFSYKNLSLSIFIQTVQGAMKNNTDIGIATDELGRRNLPKDFQYWTPENQNNEWASLNTNNNPHGYGIPRKCNYTRIKDITLSYTFPQKIMDKVGLGGLTVYLTGRNLATFTDWFGWDPESRQITRGSTNWDINYPLTRSFVFGVNLSF